MKVLSIMQPWAWLIVNGHKDIENRDWKPTNYGLKFRGKVLIHAGKKFDYDGWLWATKQFPEILIQDVEAFDKGGIVGMAEIIDCVTESKSPWFFGPYGFVIGKSRPLPFMPVKGQLGFFNVDYDMGLLK